jgi:acyl transferase domain-containing protein
MFSGQGSQYYQMGKSLYNHQPIFRYWMNKLDKIVKDLIQLSVIEHIYDKNKNETDVFNQLVLSHPAILMIEYSLAKLLLKKGIERDYVLGTSIGEFTSIAISKVLQYEYVLTSAIKQAILLEKQCNKSRMIAVFHHKDLYYQDEVLNNNSELAAINFDNHFVVSGELEKVKRIIPHLNKKNITTQVLNVPIGFHSRLIDPIADEYCNFVRRYRYMKPKIPIISCSRTQLIKDIQSDYLWEVVRKPIHFQKTINALESSNYYHYIDLGPSGTLATFVKYNLSSCSSSKVYRILNQNNVNIDYLDKLVDSLKGKC